MPHVQAACTIIKTMNLLEHEAKQLLSEAGIEIPRGKLVFSPDDFNGRVILKAQVPTGRRGREGGITIVESRDAFEQEFTRLKMLSIDGYSVSSILAEEVIDQDNELYYSLSVDNENNFVRLIADVNGGIEIEDNALAPFTRSVNQDSIAEVAKDLTIYYGYNNDAEKKISDFIRKTLNCLISNDALLLEINPLVIVDNQPLALDCKMDIDDNALFRHPKFIKKKTNANFVVINTEGDTAIVANGAGLAMASVDAVNQSGLRATNFLDIGGGASAEAIMKQFNRLAELPKLKAIIVNVFAGITRCDQVAEAIIEARRKMDNLPPLFIRLHGTNYDEAKVLLDKENMKLFKSLHDCIEAVKNA